MPVPAVHTVGEHRSGCRVLASGSCFQSRLRFASGSSLAGGVSLSSRALQETARLIVVACTVLARVDTHATVPCWGFQSMRSSNLWLPVQLGWGCSGIAQNVNLET